MYKKKTITYGNKIEIRKYHTFRCDSKSVSRSERKRPTEEAVKKANERNAKKKLLRLLEANFTPEEDMFLTLTYKPELRPDPEEGKKILTNFFRKLKRKYKSAGVELKWICSTEWNGKNIHHHLVINDVPDFNRVISECWPYGGKRYEPLYADYDYAQLADYLIKETSETFRKGENPWKQRYSCSRNLIKPEEKIEDIKASEWREDPKPSKKLQAAGYRLKKDSVVIGTDLFGYGFIEYVFEKVDKDDKHKTYGKKERVGAAET